MSKLDIKFSHGLPQLQSIAQANGLKLYRAKDYAKALEILRRVVSLN